MVFLTAYLFLYPFLHVKIIFVLKEHVLCFYSYSNVKWTLHLCNIIFLQQENRTWLKATDVLGKIGFSRMDD